MRLRSLAVTGAVVASCIAAYGQLTGSSELLGSQERITYFSGNVTMEDGTPPPDAVRLQRICKGITRDEGWTDARGRFSFKIGRGDSDTTMGDAAQATGPSAELTRAFGYNSQLSNPITTALRDCDLQLVLSGYQADHVSLAVASVGTKNLGTLVLHPNSRVSTLTVSATTLLAPSAARKAYDKGLDEISRRKWEAAASDFTKAVKIYPKFAVAWYQLGEARLGVGDAKSAVDAWNQSAAADARYMKAWERLTVAADQRHDWAESERASSAWLKLDDDDFPGAWLFNAVARAQLGKIEDAEHSAREGVRSDKAGKIPRLNYVLGLILLQEHKYGESADCFRSYLRLAPNAPDQEAVRQQLAELDRMAAAGQSHTP